MATLIPPLDAHGAMQGRTCLWVNMAVVTRLCVIRAQSTKTTMHQLSAWAAPAPACMFQATQLEIALPIRAPSTQRMTITTPAPCVYIAPQGRTLAPMDSLAPATRTSALQAR